MKLNLILKFQNKNHVNEAKESNISYQYSVWNHSFIHSLIFAAFFLVPSFLFFLSFFLFFIFMNTHTHFLSLVSLSRTDESFLHESCSRSYGEYFHVFRLFKFVRNAKISRFFSKPVCKLYAFTKMSISQVVGRFAF